MEGRMKKLLLFVFLLVLLLPGCGPGVTEDITPAALPDDVLELIAADYPRVDGSTSAYPLQMHIACTVYGVPCEWWDSSPFSLFDVTTRGIFPEEDAWEDMPEEVEKIYNIHHNGTNGSYMNLIKGDTDVILVARLPSDDEIKSAQLRGVTLNVQPVALDAFVILVNVENAVDDLSLDNIRDIYTGEVTLWSGVGGGDGEIQPYQRDRNSGSQELMEKLVMKGTPMIDAPDMIVEGMMGPFNALSSDTLGIGYSVYFYAEHMFTSETVVLIAVDGVAPTSETIGKGTYPLTTEVYIVIREDTPENSTARLFRDWLLTEVGQEVVAGSGYVPLP